MSSINEIKPLLDALDFIKFTDRAIGNKFTVALKALEVDLQDAEGGPYEPSTEAEQALNELAIEIADALEKGDDEEQEVKTVATNDEEEEEEDETLLDDSEEEELEDMTAASNDPTLDDTEEVAEVTEPEQK